MLWLLTCLAAGGQSVSPAPLAAQPPQEVTGSAGTLRLSDTLRPHFTFTTSGKTTDSVGASFTLHAVAPSTIPTGGVQATIPAGPLRGRRLRFSGSLRSQSVERSAMLWARVDGPLGQRIEYARSDVALRGTKDWTAQQVEVEIPVNAEQVLLGVSLSGTGGLSGRELRFTTWEFDPNAPIAGGVRRYLDVAFTIVRENSLWRDTVSWDTVRTIMLRRAAGAQSNADAYPAIRVLLTRLGDRHSFFIPPAANADLQADPPRNRPGEVRKRADGVGYVLVQGYGGARPDQITEYAADLEGKLKDAAKGSCGWVVDLRQNPGGNMWPMLRGLRPLLGEGLLGSFAGLGRVTSWGATESRAPVPANRLKPQPLEHAPVAVLTGPRTASSGEAVTVAFRGRPQTRSFGLGTAGLSTANQGHPLPDGATIILTGSVFGDRTGRRYGGVIQPDETVPADTVAKVAGADPTLDRAVAWLKQQPACAGSS